jgi:ferric-dicitrate binding protein FerR (iron transport regulator)
MEQNKERLQLLIEKYLEGRLTSEEYSELWSLLEQDPVDQTLEESLQALWKTSKSATPIISDNEWDRKMRQAREKIDVAAVVEPSAPRARNFFIRYRWAAAAIFLILVSGVLYRTLETRKDVMPAGSNTAVQDDRLPGGDRAVLTLADGSQILLDSTANGMIAQQGNTQVIKLEDGQLVYNINGQPLPAEAYNTLMTPRGGQYRINLPDGSRVWLNAASSLKYPVSFSGRERRVKITGEAYFEIARDVSRPFMVDVGGMEVEVLGTHFNINAYTDEFVVRTTLLEGKLNVISAGQQKILKPGQQARVTKDGGMKILNEVNLEETVAWKDGNFQFENSDIEAVMRQLARWYDLDVSYRGRVSRHFIGGISRDVKLSQVLSMLKQTGDIDFLVEGNKIIVIP